MKIAIVGSGYVGLVTGACFAQVGHQVICIDNDKQKIEMLRSGEVPIYEPGLEQLVQRNVAANRLAFTDSIQTGVDNSEVIFIAVPTPPGGWQCGFDLYRASCSRNCRNSKRISGDCRQEYSSS